MKEIKLKPETSKPKVLESAARVPKTAMREAWLKSKEKTVSELKETPFVGQKEESSNAQTNSAATQTASGMKTAAQKSADLTYRGGLCHPHRRRPRRQPGDRRRPRRRHPGL